MSISDPAATTHVQQVPIVVRDLPLDRVHPNPRQPRRHFGEEEIAGLAASIAATGVLQPITVRPGPDETWLIVMGERRWRASRLAGLSSIPAIVRWVSDEDLMLTGLIENLHREELTALEEAAAYRLIIKERGFTQDELARLVGKSRTALNQVLSVLRLPAPIQRMLADGELSRGHAIRLASVREPTTAVRLANRVRRQKLSVRQLEEILALGNLPGWEEDPADPLGKTDRMDPPAPHWDPDDPRRRKRARRSRGAGGLPEVAGVLDDWLCTRVSVSTPRGQQRGRVVIEYTDDGDLRRILEQMGAPVTEMPWGPRPAPLI